MSSKTEYVVYKVSFTNASIAQKKKFKDSCCLITISVGNGQHEALKFKSTLELVNKTFKSCIIAVCDTLQRYTYAITRPLKTPEDLYDYSKKEGDRWLERNKNAIESLTIPYTISRWDEWLNHKEFKEHYKKVCELYKNDREYANIINDYVEIYLDRLSKQHNNSLHEIDFLRGKELSIRYLKEECAAMCSWFYLDCDFDLYPPVRNESLNATYARLVDIQYQHLLAPIGLRFKKSNIHAIQNNLNDGNSPFALENIINNMPGLLHWKDREGKLLGCNKKQIDALGAKSLQEVLYKTSYDVFGPELGNEIHNSDLNIMSTAKTKIVEELNLVKGKKVMMISHKSPLLDSTGKVVGIVGMSIDMSDQHSRERQILKENDMHKITLENIIANMPGHIYWKNIKGVYLGCNDKQARSLGLKYGSEVIGKTDFDLPWDKKARDNIVHNDKLIISTKRTETLQESVVINDQKYTFVSQKSPLINTQQETVGILGVSIDITQQKILEEKYMNKTYELSNALEVKKSFLNNLSHEIRTPLHNITTIAKGLYDQWDGIDDSEKRTYLKAIVDNQDRLMSLVSNLLDVSKIRSGKLTFDYLNNDITIILKEVIAEFKYLTEPITLQIDDLVNVSALLDAERIKQVIRNLLSNAIKYGGKDKPITIRVFNMDSKYIGVSVADNGVGVPVDEKDRIFELFEESSRTKSKAGGIGLGLAICKDIILAHRGKIWVEENQPAGSIFTFTIPFARLTNKRHIMVIDDDLSTQLSISLMLKSYDYDVTILGSANEALSYLKINNNLVDVILLDLMLPDMYGVELLQRLKKIKKIKNIPIIIQTGIVDSEELENVIKLGACAYINKPFSEEVLKFNIEKCSQIID